MGLKSILAAVDRFPQDVAVLRRALEIAQRHGALLTVVHVVDLPGNIELPADLDTLQGQAEFAARDRIEEAVQRLGGNLDAVEISIAAGSPALKLIELCDMLAPDIVVMRAHQRTKIGEKILGSTTDLVIAAGKRPVLVVKCPAREAYGNAMIATDGKDDAQATLRFVETLLPDADLHLVQVVQIVAQLKEAMLRSGTDETGLRAHRNALTRLARKHLYAVASAASGLVRTRVLVGAPAKALVRAARLGNVDLIAAGPGRKSLIERAFIGSVTRRLLRDAECDVLIGRPD